MNKRELARIGQMLRRAGCQAVRAWELAAEQEKGIHASELQRVASGEICDAADKAAGLVMAAKAALAKLNGKKPVRRRKVPR